MKSLFFSVVIGLFFASSAVWAHGGRTDSCGGHNDRKHSGYHVHNYSKYCACNPDAPECKKDEGGTQKKKENSKKKGSSR
ncbi:MAG: hypothetical protein FD156_1177 [Nitrospirae bacterium]|nr:MAG: hypothetical protein FD156_1177 [Nitrospirota bacterium]